MKSLCIYFQVHQPFRLRHYTVFDVGNNTHYFDEEKNRAVLEKVAQKCYRPATRTLLNLLHRHKEFKVAFSLSGVLVEQLEAWAPDVIDLFREMAQTGRMEFLSETYYHSLSFLYSKEEFWNHVNLHREKIKKVFGVEPVKVFRNTELIFTNELAMELEKKGYKGVLAEGADYILGWRSPNHLYRSVCSDKVKLMLKNYRLSDDVAFRFSEKSWVSWPLTADTYANWLNDSPGEIINLFMDYETLGEHQWEDTGIFEFLNHLPSEVEKKKHISYLLPSEAVEKLEPVGELDIHSPSPGPIRSGTSPPGSGTVCSARLFIASTGWKRPSSIPETPRSSKSGGSSRPPTTSTICAPSGSPMGTCTNISTPMTLPMRLSSISPMPFTIWN